MHPRALGHPPQTKGPLKGMSVDMDALERQYFEIVGLDPATGGPTLKTMRELEIDYLFS